MVLHWPSKEHISEPPCCSAINHIDEPQVKSLAEPADDALGGSLSKRHELEQAIIAARTAHNTCRRKLQVEEERFAARPKQSETCSAVPGKGASTSGAPNAASKGSQALVLHDFLEEQRSQLANLSSQAQRLQEEISICTRCLAAHDISGIC